MISAPSTLNRLLLKLRTRAKQECQWLLTVGNEDTGGVLEVFERRIRLEGAGQRLCTLWTDAVVPETANEGRIGVSAAADSRDRGVWRRT